MMLLVSEEQKDLRRIERQTVAILVGLVAITFVIMCMALLVS
jgi:hypothetical protein